MAITDGIMPSRRIWIKINEYKVFVDHGSAKYDPKPKRITNEPEGYQKIKVHLVFACKHKKMFPNKNFINGESPLEKNDHPEHDNSQLCNEEQITKYKSMIGQLQWAITLGRYDILAQVMSKSDTWKG